MLLVKFVVPQFHIALHYVEEILLSDNYHSSLKYEIHYFKTLFVNINRSQFPCALSTVGGVTARRQSSFLTNPQKIVPAP
jgi:hypothetical protein